MSLLENLNQILKILEDSEIKYSIIGGVAVLLHGGRASTIDFDLYVLSEQMYPLKNAFTERGGVPVIINEHQIQITFLGVRIDILEADSVLRDSVFVRNHQKRIGEITVQVASPEDLIVMKTLADRPIDRRDIEELREIFASTIDEEYISSKLKQFG